MTPPLGELALQFALLSLVAFGGGNTTLPEMHRLVVEHHAWMTDQTFADLFALAQAAPGPNILVVSLIGLQLAGFWGFFAITLAFCLPSSLLMYGLAQWWQKTRSATWRDAVGQSVGALATGLVLASGLLMSATVAGDDNLAAWCLVAATVALVLRLRWNPLWWILAGALLGLAGVV